MDAVSAAARAASHCPAATDTFAVTTNVEIAAATWRPLHGILTNQPIRQTPPSPIQPTLCPGITSPSAAPWPSPCPTRRWPRRNTTWLTTSQRWRRTPPSPTWPTPCPGITSPSAAPWPTMLKPMSHKKVAMAEYDPADYKSALEENTPLSYTTNSLPREYVPNCHSMAKALPEPLSHKKVAAVEYYSAAPPLVAVVVCGQAGLDEGEKEREGGQQGECWQRWETISTIVTIVTIAKIATMMAERKKKIK